MLGLDRWPERTLRQTILASEIHTKTPQSGWSKTNTQHVERLIEAGEMAPAGMEAVEAAKADGRWETAYASSRDAIPPEDFLKGLSKNREAKAFFNTLNKAHVYSIVYRLETAKKPDQRKTDENDSCHDGARQNISSLILLYI